MLVTGHTGFKGGWLSTWLGWLGARVSGIALEPPTHPSLFETAGIGSFVASAMVDINDATATREALARCAPEVVFHLAAQPLVRESYTHPVATLSTNIIGLAHVLEGALACGGVRAVVVITSDKCYTLHDDERRYAEGMPLGGWDPYSASKGCAELVCAAYRRSFMERAGIPLATARAGNVHGGGDWAADRLVPDLVRAFAAGDTARIRNPTAVRPWQHVLEPLHGYLVLAERLLVDGSDFAEAWNFGPEPGDERPVADVADLLVDLWGDTARWRHVPESDAPHEAGILQLDSGKAKARLGWQPRWDLGAGLERTVAWYRAYFQGSDVLELMRDQIEAYQGLRETSPGTGPSTGGGCVAPGRHE